MEFHAAVANLPGNVPHRRSCSHYEISLIQNKHDFYQESYLS